MPHESIRPYVESAQDVYDVLQRDQTTLEARQGWRIIGLLAALVVALASTGPTASVAICMAVIAALLWVAGAVEVVARHWVMHAIDLHDLIRPRAHSTSAVLDALIEIDGLCRAAGEADSDAPAKEAGNDGQD